MEGPPTPPLPLSLFFFPWSPSLREDMHPVKNLSDHTLCAPNCVMRGDSTERPFLRRANRPGESLVRWAARSGVTPRLERRGIQRIQDPFGHRRILPIEDLSAISGTSPIFYFRCGYLGEGFTTACVMRESFSTSRSTRLYRDPSSTQKPLLAAPPRFFAIICPLSSLRNKKKMGVKSGA